MKIFNKMIVLAVLASASGIATSASAQSLTTTFSSNNYHNGNVFDISTGASAITLNSLLLNLRSGPADLKFYYRAGTSTGFQSSSAGWTLFSTNIGTASSGPDVGSLVDIVDLTFAANSTYGLYFTRTDTGYLNYTNGTGLGNVASSNSDLTVYEGYGDADPFGVSFAPRIVNATFNYTIGGATGAVPEPGTWAMMLLGFGAIGVGLRSRSKQAARIAYV